MVTAASCFTFSRLVSCVSCWVFLMTLLTSCRWIGDSRYLVDSRYPVSYLLALLHPVLPLLLALHLAHLLHGGGGGGGLPPLHRAALALLALPLQALSLLHNTGECIRA